VVRRTSSLFLLFLSFEAGNNVPVSNHGVPAQLYTFLEEQRLNNLKPETLATEKQKLFTIAKHCDINNPYEAKEYLADCKNWCNNTKRIAVHYLNTYYKYLGKEWKAPKYRKDDKLPFIPTEQELDILIATATKQNMVTLLQLLKETGIRTDESRKLQWIDINPNNTVNITPSKNSNGRILPISNKLLGMLSKLKHDSKFVFITSKKSARNTFARLTTRQAQKLNQPRLKQITLHTFRHWKGTMEYHKLRDLRAVQKILGHKSITSTETYENTESALFLTDNDEWICKAVTTKEEAIKLTEQGFTKSDEFSDGTKLYRKRK
jgi:integrase